MDWYKHKTLARHDPFIYELKQKYSWLGYGVYFQTLEIYCSEFKPIPGWFLMTTISYLKAQMGIYHNKKLLDVIDFIANWTTRKKASSDGFGKVVGEIAAEIEPNPSLISAASLRYPSSIYQKWYVNLVGNDIFLFIPNVLKIIDEYSLRRLRQRAGMSGHSPDIVRKLSDQTRPDQEKSNKKTTHGEHRIMAELYDLCRESATLSAKAGRQFPSGAFVVKSLREGIHPLAVMDGLKFLIKCQQSDTEPIKDDWALAFSSARSCRQKYDSIQLDIESLLATFGPFFNKSTSQAVN
jgi:hypothetical protein